MALVDQVGQAARARHGDVDALAQGPQLVAEADTAVEGLDRLVRMRELAQLVADLRGELTGGGEHQGSWVVRPGPLHPLHQRDAEREGLAGTGRGAATDVAPLHGRRDRGGLDRERRSDAAGGE